MSAPIAARTMALPDVAAARLLALLADAVPEVAPSIALAVHVRGEPVIELAAGWSDPDERQRAADPDLRFDLASVTKLVTASLVLRLVSPGDVRLDDPLVRHLPWFGEPSPRPVDGGQEPFTRVMLPTPPGRRWWLVDPATVTIRQLLTHTSGLAPWRTLFQVTGPTPPEPPAPDPVGIAERWAAAEAAIRTYPFVDRPGATIRYSDLGFILLGMLAVRLEGRPLDVLVGEHVAGPLGLAGLTFRPLDSGVPRTAIAPTSHDGLWRGRRSWGEVEDENATGLGGVAGHAGLFARATDIAAFGQAWLAADSRLGIDAATHAAAVAQQAADGADRRGLGWQLASVARDGGAVDSTQRGPFAALGPRAFGHTGFTGTSLVIDPDRSLVIACLTNRVWAGRGNEAIRVFLPRLGRLLAEVVPQG